MLNDEIKNGETDVLEFKRDMPDDHLKFLKTAVVHRQYINSHAASIQVALYDTHLDIVSPGGLPHGMTVKMMEEGHSRARNKALALACRYMRIIEEWGSGIPRVQRMLSEAGLKPLEIIDNGINLQFRIWRPAGNATTEKTTEKTTGKTTGKTGEQQFTTEKAGGPTERKLLEIVADNPSITMRDLATKLGITEDGVYYHVKNLRGVLKRVGGRKIGHWEVIKP